MPLNAPLWVPLTETRVTTRSPSATTDSTTAWTSGNAVTMLLPSILSPSRSRGAGAMPRSWNEGAISSSTMAWFALFLNSSSNFLTTALLSATTSARAAVNETARRAAHRASRESERVVIGQLLVENGRLDDPPIEFVTAWDLDGLRFPARV